jgi:class 3 adenylate cyclase
MTVLTYADLETLSLTDLVRLQDRLSSVVQRRFGRNLALCFTDVVGSTAYFARFGNEAGRALQQRHIDLLQAQLGRFGGRIVDTAGDGAFSAFEAVDSAVQTLVGLQESITQSNVPRTREHQLVIRAGVHFGRVLTDGVLVTGDAVNLCARVASTAAEGELRLTREAFLELPQLLRLRCRPVGRVAMKGVAEPAELFSLDWQDRARFPSLVVIEETARQIELPQRDTITFGRLRDVDGVEANDVVLELPDPALTQQISRWHFELRRRPEGFLLRPVSNGLTEVNGQVVAKGIDVPIGPGSTVRVSRVMTLRFLVEPSLTVAGAGSATVMVGG